MSNTLAPMRGIHQAITELKASDPNTALTEKALRRLVTEGTIPSIKIGRKYLVNMNVLAAYLSGNIQPKAVADGYGTIRAVNA